MDSTGFTPQRQEEDIPVPQTPSTGEAVQHLQSSIEKASGLLDRLQPGTPQHLGLSQGIENLQAMVAQVITESGAPQRDLGLRDAVSVAEQTVAEAESWFSQDDASSTISERVT